MFDIGKKGADKGQDSGAQAKGQPAKGQQPSAAADSSARRAPAVPREAAVIGPPIHIDGDLRGEEDLIIEGEVNGTVQLRNNTLTIGPQGKVSADVFAHSVYVEGYMEGDLFGSERVCVRKSAQVRGNITSPRISLEDGARFKGSIEMDPQAVEGALGKRRGSLPPQNTQDSRGPQGQQPGQAKGDGKPEAASGIKR